MKIKFLLLTLLISAMSYAQYTAIPDANFENALSAHDDIPNDGQVPTANINTLTSLEVDDKNISDLTGIEDFTALVFLSCVANQLTSLNITQNVNLEWLDCSFNELTSLDVTQNMNLEELHCFFNELTSLDVTQNTTLSVLNLNLNQLTSLDVTQNTALLGLNLNLNQLTSLDVTQNVNLLVLFCRENQLTSLDVTQNINLERLNLGSNELTSLDITQNGVLLDLFCDNNLLTSLDVRNGNNTAIIDFSGSNNPNLSCIIVDDATYSTTNWTEIDATSTFVETEEACNTLSILDTAFNTSLSIYPNPTKNQVNIKTDRNANYMISSISGQILQKGILTQGTNVLEISTLSQGIYFIKIKDNQTEVTQKLIIK